VTGADTPSLGTGRLPSYLPPLSVAIPITIFSLAALALPLATGHTLGLSTAQTTGWLLVLYGIPGVLSLLLTVAYHQPLLVAWHSAVVAFLASLVGHAQYSDLLGATLVGGLLVTALGALGLTHRVARLVPTPVVFAVVAANVLPFVAGIFTALGNEPLVVGGTLVAYFLGRRFFGPRLPPVLPALIVGLALAAATGRFAPLPDGFALPRLEPTRPTFALPVLLAVVPVFVALTALQANLTAGVYLRAEGYAPPMRAIDVATGLGSAAAAFLGPAPICMGSLVTPLTAGAEAGERAVRPWSVYASAAGWIIIALGAGVAAELPAVLPLPLLLAVAGLALVGVLAQTLGEVTRGPLRLGPLFAFAVAASQLSLLGLGPLFWALLLGTAVSLLLEGEALRDGRAGATA
jgi:benzoate membrane transport protein